MALTGRRRLAGATGRRRLTEQQRFASALVALIVVAAVTLGLVVHARQARSDAGAAALESAAPDSRSPTERQLAALQIRLHDRPGDPALLASLGQIYVQRARETGDPAYYPRAEEAFRRALARDQNNVDALAGLGSLALSRHQFREALDWGQRARALAPQVAYLYGVIGDAQTELGLYPEAVATFQQMVDLRPDLGSYARVSYARELHGQSAGAIEAMQRAVAAGSPGAEGTAWTRVQLATLYFNSGQLDAAATEYNHALFEVPGYLHAEAGLGRVAAARGDYATAIARYTEATAAIPVTQYVIELGDVYAAAGQPDRAAEQYALVRVQERLLAANGVNNDLEFALFAADHPAAGLTPSAVVDQARAALVARPGIYGHDTLAWALYRAGAYDEASRESAAALALGTQDALLYFHAGMIARARGDDAAASAALTRALAINPAFSILHAPEARAALAGR
jgi:tetratricopeptide (TPR) repeat protein